MALQILIVPSYFTSLLLALRPLDFFYQVMLTFQCLLYMSISMENSLTAENVYRLLNRSNIKQEFKDIYKRQNILSKNNPENSIFQKYSFVGQVLNFH